MKSEMAPGERVRAPERDTLEFAAALVLGTVLGAGITWLLLPEARRGGRGWGRLKERLGVGGPRGRSRAAVDRVSREARSLGQEFVDAMRSEAGRLLREAGGRLRPDSPDGNGSGR